MTTTPPTPLEPSEAPSRFAADQRLRRVVLHDAGLADPRLGTEYRQALAELQTDGRFAAAAGHGPFCLALSVRDGRLLFDVQDAAGTSLPTFGLALGPFRTLIRDYFLLLDSYADTQRDGRGARLQAIDMGRRGLHNEAAALLQARLGRRFAVDLPTARRLFTLLCALHTRMAPVP